MVSKQHFGIIANKQKHSETHLPSVEPNAVIPVFLCSLQMSAPRRRALWRSADSQGAANFLNRRALEFNESVNVSPFLHINR